MNHEWLGGGFVEGCWSFTVSDAPTKVWFRPELSDAMWVSLFWSSSTAPHESCVRATSMAVCVRQSFLLQACHQMFFSGVDRARHPGTQPKFKRFRMECPIVVPCMSS